MSIVGSIDETSHPGIDSKQRADIVVAVVDDHDLVSSLLVGVLAEAGFTAFAGYHEDEGEMVVDLRQRSADVVLLDYFLGDGTAEHLIGEIKAGGAAVVMLTATEDPVTIAQCVEAGAVGHLSKGVSPDELVDAVERVVTTGELLSEEERFDLSATLRQAQSRTEAELAPFRRLTEREQQVMKAICDGRSAAQMAEAWDVSVATVRSHIRAVLVKLNVGSQLEAAAMARRVGWPERPDS